MTDQPWSTHPWNASESTPEPIQESAPDTEPETTPPFTQESDEDVDHSLPEAVTVEPTTHFATTDEVAPAAPWYASAIAASVDEPEFESVGDEEADSDVASEVQDGPSATAVVMDKGAKKEKGTDKGSRVEKSPGKAKREKRVTLKVKVPKSLRTSLVREAKQRDLSVGELLAAYLTDRMNP